MSCVYFTRLLGLLWHHFKKFLRIWILRKVRRIHRPLLQANLILLLAWMTSSPILEIREKFCWYHYPKKIASPFVVPSKSFENRCDHFDPALAVGIRLNGHKSLCWRSAKIWFGVTYTKQKFDQPLFFHPNVSRFDVFISLRLSQWGSDWMDTSCSFEILEKGGGPPPTKKWKKDNVNPILQGYFEFTQVVYYDTVLLWQWFALHPPLPCLVSRREY